MTGQPALLPGGFSDRLPPAAEAASHLTRIIVDGFASHGYERVAPPLVETELSLAHWLGRPLGSALFRSPDPATGAALAIRPDITGQIARIAATRLRRAPRPLRLAYAGQVLRARATELDPARERTQAGAELIGNDSVVALAEVMGAAIEALQTAGVTAISIDLTTPELVQELAASRWPVADTDALLALLDGKDWGALDTPELRPWQALLAAAGPAEAALPALALIAPASAARLSALVTALGAALPAIRITIDPTERHGFEYQSWAGFSLFGAVEGAPLRQEIGRGGAYHIRHGNGATEPAAGVSLYIDTLVDAGLGQSLKPRIFLPPGTPAHDAAALRAQGFATVAALSSVQEADLTTSEPPADCAYIWTNGLATLKG